MGLFRKWSMMWEDKLEEDFSKTIDAEVEVINLECEGFYSLTVREYESFSYHGGGSNMSKTEYVVDCNYTINVTIEKELTSVKLASSSYVLTLPKEDEAYQFAIENTKNFGEEVLKSMTDSLTREFKKHIVDNKLDKLKKSLSNIDKKQVSFNITINKK